MLQKTNIEKLILDLDSLYHNCHKSDLEVYYSKFACLELCGWIELAMDDIVIEYANNNLYESHNILYIKEKVIGNTFGFHYDNHFRPMIMRLVGLNYLELIESELNKTGELDILKAELSTLWGIRKSAAHTTVTVGTAVSYNSPSIIKNHLDNVYPILDKINKLIN